MLIQESFHDVPTKAGGDMREYYTYPHISSPLSSLMILLRIQLLVQVVVRSASSTQHLADVLFLLQGYTSSTPLSLDFLRLDSRVW